MAVRRRSLIAAVAGLAWVLAACDRAGRPAGAAPSFKAIDITGAEYAKGFDLPDTDGRRRTLADFKGRVVVVFFGFTQCPDVCPSTLVELAQIRQTLGPAGERVQVVFITLDPERDTPPLLKAYVDNFGAGVVALRGTLEETTAVAKHFKIFFAKVPGKTPGAYSLDHTAGSFIFDAQGRVRLFTRYGSGPDALKSDLQSLLAAS